MYSVDTKWYSDLRCGSRRRGTRGEGAGSIDPAGGVTRLTGRVAMTTGERENGAAARGPRTTVATGRGKGGSSLFNNQMFLVAVFTALRAVVGGVALIVDEGIIDDRRKGQTVSRVRRQFWAVTSPLTSNEFKRCFRMSRESFKNLVEMVRGRLTRNETMANRSSRRASHTRSVSGHHSAALGWC